MMTPVEEAQLRQEEAVFYLLLSQAKSWFTLRVSLVLVAVAIVVYVTAFCSFILLHPQGHSEKVILSTMGVLFGGVPAALATIWKVALSSKSAPQVRPMTSANPKAAARSSVALRQAAKTDIGPMSFVARASVSGGQRRQKYGQRRPPHV